MSHPNHPDVRCLPLSSGSCSPCARFDLVAAGHHFLTRVLPPRAPESYEALEAFVQRLETIDLPAADVDAVLLRCLTALHRQTSGGLLSPVDEYLVAHVGPLGAADRFAACVRRLLRSRAVADVRIRDAMALIEREHGDPHLNRARIASAVGLTASALSGAFRRATGLTITEYIRNVRLSHAAKLLVHARLTVKEVWARSGYNHASNFNHDFKRRFQVSPREYRAYASDIAYEPDYGAWMTRAAATRTPRLHAVRVLVVDADERSRGMVGQFLQMKGYSVVTASSGQEALSEATRLSPHVVLLACRLDDMDSLECLEALRRRPIDQPAVALFTADWELYDRASDVDRLGAVMMSKLCDLEQVDASVRYLSDTVTIVHRRDGQGARCGATDRRGRVRAITAPSDRKPINRTYHQDAALVPRTPNQHPSMVESVGTPSRHVTDRSVDMAETIQAKVYRGMPRVELTEENNVVLQVELTESVSQKVIDGAMKGPISISLESLDVDLQHNQSFGMVSASTGCISNPGGPGC